MICPYCLDDVSAKSLEHKDCKIVSGKEFPPAYVRLHEGADADDPVVFSVVGSVGHGKTVFLCALFDFLDNHLTDIWPGFFSHVLDQDSLSRLNENRNLLRKGELPPATQQSFPRPGIFRLTKMPQSVESGLPWLKDTTVLIYDPPGEAFSTDKNISKLASFVRRGSSVLFLIDIASLGDSIPDKMAELLDTYLLGMEHLGLERKSQHLIVVYTKSDALNVSVPEFRSFLEKHPGLRDYLSDQRPCSLIDPHRHLEDLRDISSLLHEFTKTELRAVKFTNAAEHWFDSVSFTAVSSLGAAPEDHQGEKKMSVKMSPRGVVDPLLYVLAKSIKRKKETTPWWRHIKTKAGMVMGVAILIALATTVYFYGFYNRDFRRAVACQEEKNFKCAIANYSQAIRGSPDYAAAYSGRGWAHLELGHAEDALDDCGRALQLQPENAESLTCRGRGNSLKHAYDQAFSDCDRAVTLQPTYAPAFQCRGFVYWYQGNNQRAIEDYAKAIEQDVAFSRAYLNRAVAYSEINNSALALGDRKKASELEPQRVQDFIHEHVLAYCNRGREQSKGGEYTKAIKDFDKALQLNPEWMEAYANRGEANMALGRYDQSDRDYTEVIMRDGENVAAFLNRGDARHAMSRYQGAVEDFTEVLKRNPEINQAYLKRSSTYLRQNEFEKAITDCDTVINKKPPGDLKAAYFQEGQIYLKKGEYRGGNLGDYEMAAQMYKKAADQDPDDGEALYWAAVAKARKIQWDVATNYYELAVEKDESLGSRTDSALSDAFYKRGAECEWQSKNESYSDDWPELRRCVVSNYQTALKLDPHNRRARAAFNNFQP
ncbi:MAG TPA: tetratricopeptide repeat protein [Pyrinomonadaceae bacterium]|nr:tetratricopeptide repeat protein [Pyrinomonadaceae bacterium]